MDSTPLPTRRRLLQLGAGSLALGVGAPALVSRALAQTPMRTDFAGERLVVNHYGGSFGAAWKQHVIDPFERRFNARISVVESLTGDTVARVRASRNNPQMDTAILGDSGAVVLAAENLYQPMTEATVPNLRDLLPIARIPGDPYAEFIFASEVLAYNKTKVPTEPTSWNDLYKPEYQRRILIPDLANSTSGPVFLVHLAEMNGGSAENIDPGFAALERLKPNILTYWSSQQQISSLLASGEAFIAVWSADRAGALMQQGAPIGLSYPKEGVKVFGNGIGIVNGTRKTELAQAYVNFVLSRDVQSAFCAGALLAPTNQHATLPDAVKPFVPDLATTTPTNWKVVVDQLPQWIDRWNRTITR